MSEKMRPPELPPRAGTEPPPPYTEVDNSPCPSLLAEDPRSSSTQSLVPEGEVIETTRTMLLVYIHGFMGKETSFQIFPAHVHDVVKALLAGSHTVHTKIYPRYRSRKTIDFARDDFSKWLAPHESHSTDVILLGHSMGGLLSAEVVLQMPETPASGLAFRHRILGTINFDTPFLGMHPRIVKSGLASLFRSDDTKRAQEGGSSNPTSPSNASLASPSTTTINSSEDVLSPTTSRTTASSGGKAPVHQDTLFSPSGSDPTFNPKFDNDVNLPIRNGWQRGFHFFEKHSENILKAGKQVVKAHVDFGSTMADFAGLNQRYWRIRLLEDEDETQRRSGQGARLPNQVQVPRVRFVNFYTASTGRPKKGKSRPGSGTDREDDAENSVWALNPPPSSTAASPRSWLPSPSISLEEVREDGSVQKKEANVLEASLSPRPSTESEGTDSSLEVDETASIEGGPAAIPNFPPLPLPPMEPSPPNLDMYSDKDVRKVVQREHGRALKSYQQALKHRKRALKDRARIEEEYHKRLEKASKALKEETTLTKDKKSRKKKPSPEDVAAAKKAAGSKGLNKPDPPSRAPPPPPIDIAGQDPTSDLDVEEAAILAKYRSAESALLSSRPAQPPPSPQPIPSSADTNAPISEPPRPRSTTTTTPITLDPNTAKGKASATPIAETAPKKHREFCNLPPETADGRLDPTWQRVVMRDVDEVGAHCGLFVADGGGRYELLVGEVSGKIEEWVRADMASRFVGG